MHFKRSLILEPQSIANLQALVGAGSEHLDFIEQELNIEIGGNNFNLELLASSELELDLAQTVLESLYHQTFGNKGKVIELENKDIYLTIHEIRGIFQNRLELDERERQLQLQRFEQAKEQARQLELEQALLEEQALNELSLLQERYAQSETERKAVSTQAQVTDSTLETETSPFAMHLGGTLSTLAMPSVNHVNSEAAHAQALKDKNKLSPTVQELIAKAKQAQANNESVRESLAADNKLEYTESLAAKRDYWDYAADEVVPVHESHRDNLFADFENLFEPLEPQQKYQDKEEYSPTFLDELSKLLGAQLPEQTQDLETVEQTIKNKSVQQALAENKQQAATTSQATESDHSYLNSFALPFNLFSEDELAASKAPTAQESVTDSKKADRDTVSTESVRATEQQEVKKETTPSLPFDLLEFFGLAESKNSEQEELELAQEVADEDETVDTAAIEELISTFTPSSIVTDLKEVTMGDYITASSPFAKSILTDGDYYYLFYYDEVEEVNGEPNLDITWYLKQYDLASEEASEVEEDLTILDSNFTAIDLPPMQRALEFMAYCKLRYLQHLGLTDWTYGVPDTYLDIILSGDNNAGKPVAVDFMQEMQAYQEQVDQDGLNAAKEADQAAGRAEPEEQEIDLASLVSGFKEALNVRPKTTQAQGTEAEPRVTNEQTAPRLPSHLANFAQDKAQYHGHACSHGKACEHEHEEMPYSEEELLKRLEQLRQLGIDFNLGKIAPSAAATETNSTRTMDKVTGTPIVTAKSSATTNQAPTTESDALAALAAAFGNQTQLAFSREASQEATNHQGSKSPVTTQVTAPVDVDAAQANDAIDIYNLPTIEEVESFAPPVSQLEIVPEVKLSRNKQLQNEEREAAISSLNGKYSSVLGVKCRSVNQHIYVNGIDANDVTFGIGPAGSGKTFLAVAKALEYLNAHKVERIVLTRPAVEAGESLGYLPGTLEDKLDPYLKPLYDAIAELVGPMKAKALLESSQVEIVPLAFMRGRTLSNAFIILDEAQNTTAMQMKMAITRLGLNSKMVITGDVTQNDLPKNVKSGLVQVQKILDDVNGLRFYYLDKSDVVRHRCVSAVIEAYDQWELLHPEDSHDSEVARQAKQRRHKSMLATVLDDLAPKESQ